MTEKINLYKQYLINEEKSELTVEKYLRDVRSFMTFLNGSEITKEKVLEFKASLKGRLKITSANSVLVSVNGFLRFIDCGEKTVKLFKSARKIFTDEERELTKADYLRLLSVAGESRISYIIKTICSTGIRISELKYITVEAVKAGRAEITCKNKTRVILIPSKIKSLLKNYIKKAEIKFGTIFVSKNGNPINRSNIWKEMKALCKKCGVSEKKVFPHNLRHLFAKTFYKAERDIVKLADILGHSSINTTRIYTMESGKTHLARLNTIENLLIT